LLYKVLKNSQYWSQTAIEDKGFAIKTETIFNGTTEEDLKNFEQYITEKEIEVIK
jgi:hypothetical protein